jgi:glycine cleavage system H protein
VDGEVSEVNEEINDDPGLINADPYGAGWLFRVQLASADGELPAGLLSAADYAELTKDTE